MDVNEQLPIGSWLTLRPRGRPPAMGQSPALGQVLIEAAGSACIDLQDHGLHGGLWETTRWNGLMAVAYNTGNFPQIFVIQKGLAGLL